MRPFTLARVLVIALLLGFAPQIAFSQGDPNTENGFKLYGSYDGTTMDTINLMNGNLTLHIPLPFYYAQRGGRLDPRYFLVENSKNWTVTYIVAGDSIEYYWTYAGATGRPTAAWAYNGAYVATPISSPTLFRTYVLTTPDGFPTTASASIAGLTTWDGSSHPLSLYNSTEDTTGFQFTQSNPDSYGIPQTATLTDRNGNVYQGNFANSGGCTHPSPGGPAGQTIVTTCQQSMASAPVDSNGNEYFSTDTLGRNTPTSTPAANTTGCVSSLPIASATIYSYTGPTGATETLELCYGTVTYQTEFTEPGTVIQQAQNSIDAKTGTVVVTMILNDGTKYTFDWDSYGNVTSIGLPTGGSITYNWTQISMQCMSDSLGYVSRAVASRTINDGTNSRTWTYTWGTEASGSITNMVTDPLGNTTVHVFSAVVPQSCNLYENTTKVYQGSSTSGQLLETVNTTYTGTLNGEIAINVVPTNITTTMGSSVKSVTKTYDTGLGTGQPIFGDVLTELDYDWGASPHGPLLRQTNTNYLWQTNSSYATAGLLDLTSSVVVENATGTRVAETDYTYDESAYLTASNITTNHVSPPEGVRGNLSTVSKWLNTGSAVVSHTNWYDTGEPYKKIDPKGNATTYAYSGTYAGAYPTTSTNALGQITTNAYDFNTGVLTSTKDPNGQTTSFAYDTMFRKAQETYPDGGQTSYCYTDTGGATCSASAAPFDLVITKKISSSLNLTETAVTDGLGRLVQSQLNSDPSGVVYVDTTYDADGRKYTVSNPYRTKTDPTYGFTSTVYDALGRTCVLIPPDGTAVANTSCPTAQPSNDVFTTYSGNTTTVTDQQSKSRKSQTDGLGRLTNVWEDPSDLNYATVYTYDPLGDLGSVVQGGSRNRSFVYDSLKRLTSSTNPESGNVTYTYDADSNVLTKKDARAFTITYAYDAMNRMTGRTYSNGDHAVTYAYDQSGCLGVTCYNVGRRTGMTDAAGSESWAYDSMGRELAEQRTTNSVTKNTSYTYNLDGTLATLTYPSGNGVAYKTNGAERPSSAFGNVFKYVETALYSPAGALSFLSASDGSIVSSMYYNTRLQPCRISVKSSGTAPTSCTDTSNIGNILDYTYNFNLGTGDNGNVMGITNNVDTTRSTQFTYGRLNRIVTAETTSTHATSPTNCWGESYTEDQWGNVTAIGVASTAYNGCTQESLSITISANNQISVAGFSYDASGNVLADGTNTYTWNAESQIKSAAGVNYTYDGDGDRVQKSNGKIYWYGAGSEILDETDLSGNLTDEYIFFGGNRIARVDSSNNIVYYAADHLGTARVVVSSTGTILDQSDFYPFGGERVLSTSSGNRYKFEGKERDAETNNDDFGARYYSSQFGRWLSPDWSAIPEPVPYANLTNPQTLNLYAMVRDNPETFADLDGHDPGAMIQAGKDSVGGVPENPTLATEQEDPQQPQQATQTPTMSPTPQQPAPTPTIGPNPDWTDSRQATCLGQGVKTGLADLIPFHDELKAVGDSVADGSVAPLKTLVSVGTAAEAGKAGAKDVAESRSAQKAIKSLINSAGGRISANAVGRGATLAGKAFAIITLAIAAKAGYSEFRACMAN